MVNGDFCNLKETCCHYANIDGSCSLTACKNKQIDRIILNAPTVEAIPIEQLLSILPKYDDYIHTKTYRHNETMEYIYSKGHEDGWNACLKAIKEELEDWEE